jgi:hypothetical protein
MKTIALKNISIYILLLLLTSFSISTVTAKQAEIDPQVQELLDRFASTKAVGVFTKLSIKNNVTRLSSDYGAYHKGNRPPNLEELKERYDLMIKEMMVLVQNKDPELAKDLYASRTVLYTYLADPDKYIAL